MRPAVLLIIVGCQLASFGGWADAQAPAENGADPEKSVNTDNAPADIGSVAPSYLDVRYLRNEDGRLVPTIENLSHELLVELHDRYRNRKKDEQPDEPKTAYQFNKITIAGRVSEATADLNIHVVLTVLAKGRVRVPLRLGNARLIDVPKIKGKAAAYIDFDGDTEQHICWVEGEPGDQCTIDMPMRTLVHQVGEMSTFVLSAPQAAMSQFTLRVPRPNLVLESGKEFEVEHTGDATIFSSAIHRDLEVSWRPPPTADGKPPTVLRAETRMSVRFAGEASVSANVRLEVESLSGPFEGFTVQLPPGMDLLTIKRENADGPRDFRSQVRDPEPGKDSREGKLVDVSFPPTSEIVVLELSADRQKVNPNPGSAPKAVELAGFSIVGARIDSGLIDVYIDRDWSAMFETEVAYQIEAPPESRDKGVVARFRYDQQPYSLRATVQRRKTRVTVDPVYIVQVDPDRISVEARLSYFVRGSIVDRLEVQMPGWEIDAVSSDSQATIDRNTFDPSQKDAPLAIPLTKQSNTFQLTVEAHRDVAPDEESLAFLLPRPVADTVTPAVVVVSPAHNVQLTPNVEAMSALAVDLLPPQLKDLPTNRQAPLFFRDRGASEPAQFLARYEIRPRIVTVGEDTRLDFDERRVHVEQVLNYNIANEPLTALTLLAPRMALTPDNLQVSLDGDNLTWTEVTAADSSNAAATLTSVKVTLPTSRIGACRLTLAYSLQLPVLTVGQSQLWKVPLVMPDGGQATTFESRTARIFTQETIRVEPTGDHWSGDEAAPSSDGLTLVAEAETRDLPLALSLLEPQRQSASVVRQGWVQTTFNGERRQDRAVYRLATTDKVVRIRLPAGAQLEEAAIDGRIVTEQRRSPQDELLIDAPPGDGQRQFVLELWYTLQAEPSSPWGRASLELPQVAGASWAKRLYWQLALPRDEHLWLAPSGWTPELTWRWRPLFGEIGYWDRQTNLDQQDLERWIGASRQPGGSVGGNRYLFSTFGMPDRVEVVTISRRTMLLLASAAAMGLGLLLIFLPVLRHPAILLPAGLAVAAVALLYPEPAIQVAQAAVVGLAVVIVARLLNWLLVRGRNQRAVIRGTSLMGREPSASDARLPQGEADSQMSTATAALAVHVGGGDSKA